MKIYFDNLQQIEKSEFLNKFREHEHMDDGNPKDGMVKQIFEKLQDSNSLNYYLGILNKKGIENLILPQHDHDYIKDGNPDRPVKVGGEKFSTVTRAYIEDYIPNSKFPNCRNKIRELKQKSGFFNKDDSILKADFLFVCSQKEYAHPGPQYDNSHGQNKIYIGNGFHRFVAYSLWVSENGFKPLELYYVGSL